MMRSMFMAALLCAVALSASAEERESSLPVAPMQKEVPAPETAPANMFDDADTDGDGVLSKQEFLGRAEAHFKEMDMDADGTVTADEMRALNSKKQLQMRQYIKQQPAVGAPPPVEKKQ